MQVAVVLFTCDLRVRDHPALAAAVREAAQVVPAFVLDDAILGHDFARPNRLSYLCDALADLDCSLRRLGASLVVRRGDVVDEAMAMAAEVQAEAIYLTEDVSAYARRRQQRLSAAADSARIQLRGFEGATVVPAGYLTPAGGDHFKVFTPYHRQWTATDLRAVEKAPARLSAPGGVEGAGVPRLSELTDGTPSPDLKAGGETEARRRATSWLDDGAERYHETHDDLAGDATSRLSPDLHFGCLSARELVSLAPEGPGGEAFVRQLCWRDFHRQVLHATPELPRQDYRTRGDEWRRNADDLATWKEGGTGVPVVDAGMRQLAREGWMHNRSRLVTASFLTKDLYLDWRLGASHFWDLLVDGDIANNAGNWQWVAGTGNDTRPNRVLNPLRQADRFDPQGDYVRRYVPELAGVEGPAVHRPWKLADHVRKALDYPDPMVDHDQAATEFRHRRDGGSTQARRPRAHDDHWDEH